MTNDKKPAPQKPTPQPKPGIIRESANPPSFVVPKPPQK